MASMSLEMEVLDATADDWESLEQIYAQIKRRRHSASRAEVADEMFRLFRYGLFKVMYDLIPLDAAAIVADPEIYWFMMTEQGRTHWESECSRLEAERDQSA